MKHRQGTGTITQQVKLLVVVPTFYTDALRYVCSDSNAIPLSLSPEMQKAQVLKASEFDQLWRSLCVSLILKVVAHNNRPPVSHSSALKI